MQKAARAILLVAPIVLILSCNIPSEPAKVLIRPYQMKLIPGGTFSMGADNLEYDSINATPVHQVTVDSFYMDSTEVTQKEYLDYMLINPAKWAGLNSPVENVSWFDAVLFANARSKREHPRYDTVYSYSAAYFHSTTTGVSCSSLTNLRCDLSKKGYRLPTEAEWEYACRAGTTTEVYWGHQEIQDTTDMYSWFVYNSNRRPHTVAIKFPNAWGLYDMIGNVSEWCNEWYEDGYPSPNPVVNPVGPNNGVERVRRGGDFTGNCTTASGGRSGMRRSDIPTVCTETNGFRLVLPRK